jgi:NADH:ubiquinone oxidoreductase subunit 5 (subunit L)/multisubunit Na+/H+ antiporter MnhA subunit
MEYIILSLIGLTLLGFVITVFLPKSNENTIAQAVRLITGLHLLVSLVFVTLWIIQGGGNVHLRETSIMKSAEYDFFIDLYADRLTVVFLLFGSILTFLIGIFSRRYLHRESGYKRFFTVLMFFFFGYSLVIFSGNFETMFIGWEVLGISSFLLIAFYRTRYLPVKNAVKVFSIYRIGDVGLILAMWLSHHLWGHNLAFYELNDAKAVHSHLLNHSAEAIGISLLIFLTATAKSALFPFSSWLPRAMEGPTPSSAVFYGSLSVHIGAFLMLRTFHYWEDQTVVRFVIGGVGLLTAVMANFSARVQSSVKSQIGYASIAQIGLIFIEIAAGLEWLALIHIAANAFYRTYQLLISPSVVTYKIREQFYHFVPRAKTLEDSFPKRLEYTLYLWSLREWNLDNAMYRFLWNPLKRFGNQLHFLSIRRVAWFFVPVFGTGVAMYYFKADLPVSLQTALPILFGAIGLTMVLKAFTERKSVLTSWILVVMNHVWIVLAVAFSEKLSLTELVYYFSGIAVAATVGVLCLRRLMRLEEEVTLDKFHGHVYEHPKITAVFLLACLGLAGFPITPTFIGEDLLFSHIEEHQFALAALASLSFIIDGIALIRIYSRVFLGPHYKTYHEVAKRSS